jgi:hypothetical protein
MIASCALSTRKRHSDKQHASLTFRHRGDNARPRGRERALAILTAPSARKIGLARSWNLDALPALPAGLGQVSPTGCRDDYHPCTLRTICAHTGLCIDRAGCDKIIASRGFSASETVRSAKRDGGGSNL